MAEINPFNDVPTIQEPNSVQQVGGMDYLSSPSGLMIGAGGQAIKADPFSGFWVGGRTFATAPFSVDLNGNVILNSATILGYASDADITAVEGDITSLEGSVLTKASTTQILSGVIKLGGDNLIMDGANVQIRMADASNTRLMLGKRVT